MCVQDATGAARDYAKNVQEHCKAINLHQLATSTNNDCHEGEPDLPVEDCSLPYQVYKASEWSYFLIFSNMQYLVCFMDTYIRGLSLCTYIRGLWLLCYFSRSTDI